MADSAVTLGIALAALIVTIGGFVSLLMVVRAGERRLMREIAVAESPRPAPRVMEPPRIVFRGRRPWDGATPAPPEASPFVSRGVGPTVGGAGSFRPLTSVGGAPHAFHAQERHGLGGRLSGRVTTNPAALCTVCGGLLTECGGHH